MREDILFEPLKVGSKTITKSRFVMPAMNAHSVDEHTFKERGIAYFLERSKGGFGMLVSEWLAPDPDGLGSLKQAAIWDDSYIEGLSHLTEAVHKEGSLIIGQLHHAGYKSQSLKEGFVPKAVSPINVRGKVLETYTTEEIKEIINKFIKAGKRAKKANFDGVEIHCAHGYLFGQILSKNLNRRVDEYGGDYQGRFKAVKEIINGIKKECGKDFIVGMRINAYDGLTPYENTTDENNLNDYCIYAEMGEEAGIDYISVSHRGIILTYVEDPGFNQDAVMEIKKHVSVPIIYAGRVNDVNVAINILQNKKADLIALGRESICDPHFPIKIKEGKTNLIYHCMGCQQRCSPDIGCEEDDIGSSCMLNPFSNKETRWKIEEAKTKKNVTIIGAGCAGMQAAWVLAARGHNVTVYEASKEVGGNLIAAAVAPKKLGFTQAIYTIYQHCLYYGVKFELNHKVTQEEIEKMNSDVVIDATGSKPFRPNIKGASELPFAEDVLLKRMAISGKKVAIIGGGSVGLETAEILMKDNKVDIIEMDSAIAKDMVPMVKTKIMPKMVGKVNMMTDTKVLEINDKTIKVEVASKTKELTGYDYILLASGYKARKEINVNVLAKEHYEIGDASQVSNAKFNIYNATKLGLKI